MDKMSYHFEKSLPGQWGPLGSSQNGNAKGRQTHVSIHWFEMALKYVYLWQMLGHQFINM